jgi:hypothetical protein
MDPRKVPIWGILSLLTFSITPISSVVVRVAIGMGVFVDLIRGVEVSGIVVLLEKSA